MWSAICAKTTRHGPPGRCYYGIHRCRLNSAGADLASDEISEAISKLHGSTSALPCYHQLNTTLGFPQCESDPSLCSTVPLDGPLDHCCQFAMVNSTTCMRVFPEFGLNSLGNKSHGSSY
jgi:hypothetical protein